MGKTDKKPTFNYYLRKNGKMVNLKDLSKEEQDQVGIWAYQTMVKALGYRPVKEQQKIPKRDGEFMREHTYENTKK